MAARMPTYITLKDVKKRWGKGQEDIFPVAQFEKLWGDMTALRGIALPVSWSSAASAASRLKEPGATRWLAARWIGRLSGVIGRLVVWLH